MAQPAAGTRSPARTAPSAAAGPADHIAPARLDGTERAQHDALQRLLTRPRSLGRAGEIALAVAAAVVLVGLGAAEAMASPTVTVGGFLILVVLIASWALPAWAALAVTAEAMAVPLVATQLGSESDIAAELKVVAMLIMAVTVRVAVRALQRSDALVQARTRQLVEANAGLRRFTADAAHEFRAPLAFIQSEIDVALAAPGDAQEYRSHLRTIGDEVARMATFTSSLLTLAQADAGTLAGAFRTVDLVDLLEVALSRWQGAAERGAVRLSGDIPDEGTVHGDPDLLGRVVDNLLDNALRHAATRVTLNAQCVDDAWEIAVSDDGPGVPPAQRERIFERFARGERQRSARAGGAGLGLALSRAIVEAHGGTLQVREGGRGATFVVRVSRGLYSASFQD